MYSSKPKIAIFWPGKRAKAEISLQIALVIAEIHPMNAAFRRKTIQHSLWMKNQSFGSVFQMTRARAVHFQFQNVLSGYLVHVTDLCVKAPPKCRMGVFWLVLPLVLKKTNAWNESNWVSVDVEWTQPAQSLSLAKKKKKKKNDSCFVWFERSLYWRVCWKLVSDFFFFALEDRHCFCF